MLDRPLCLGIEMCCAQPGQEHEPSQARPLTAWEVKGDSSSCESGLQPAISKAASCTIQEGAHPRQFPKWVGKLLEVP